MRKKQSPHDKHWLCNDRCEEICTGQAAQENVTGSLQGGVLGDSDNNGEVTKERKNSTGYIYSGEEDVVDERGRFVSCQCSPARQPTNSGIFFVHYLVLWVTDSVVMWFKMLSTSEINKKSHVNAFHAFKCRSVARREYFGTEICFHLLPRTRFISYSEINAR